MVLGYKVIYYIPIDDGMEQVLGRAGIHIIKAVNREDKRSRR